MKEAEVLQLYDQYGKVTNALWLARHNSFTDDQKSTWNPKIREDAELGAEIHRSVLPPELMELHESVLLGMQKGLGWVIENFMRGESIEIWEVSGDT